MALTWILLIVGFGLITYGASWLTNGASAVAQRLKISEFIIGMTIVAVGTSLPELTVSIASTFNGSADLAIGNVVGSNIFNILFILGLCSVIKPIIFSRNNLRVDIVVCLTVSVLLALMLWGGSLSRIEGIVLLLLYIAIICLSIRMGKKEAIEAEEKEESSGEILPWWKSIVFICVGFAALVYGADLTLDSAVAIARDLGISERVIGITLLAGGTSLPEVAASLVALYKGHGAMALGNVIGSNIANILLILGTCATISPLTMSGITAIDLGAMVAAAVILVISALLFGYRRITRAEGVAFLMIYAAYIWYLTL